jgi:hypothetical protein
MPSWLKVALITLAGLWLFIAVFSFVILKLF